MIIIADDLTGAGDTAIQFSKEGFRAIVFPRVENLINNQQILKDYSIISINTDTRALPGPQAYSTIYNFTKKMPHEIIFKKFDSMLRGNPGIEIQAVLDATNSEIAYIAPSFPDNHRIVENGILKSGLTHIDVIKQFSQEIKDEVIHIPYNVIRDTKQNLKLFIETEIKRKKSAFVIFDAITDEDLQRIYVATRHINQKSIYCGSAGFAKIIANGISVEILKKTGSQNNANKDTRKSLVVVGSVNYVTKAQLVKLSEKYPNQVVFVKTEKLQIKTKTTIDETIEKCEQVLNKDTDFLVIAVDSILKNYSFYETESANWQKTAKAIGESLGKIVSHLISNYKFSSIVTTGGDTSLQVCKTIGVNGIESLSEIAPGIPLGKIIGGKASGCEIITKSGGFGDENSLLKILEFLKQYRSI